MWSHQEKDTEQKKFVFKNNNRKTKTNNSKLRLTAQNSNQ
jgi:hypothetical protein